MYYLIIGIINVLCLTSVYASENNSIWVDVTYSYEYGKTITHEKGCQLALEKAKQEAIRKVHGERIYSEDNLVCHEKQGCELYQYIWNNLNGLLLDIKNIKYKSGHKNFSCNVSASIQLSKSKNTNDPNFDFAPLLNKRIFRDEEEIIIHIESKIKQYYLSIFQYDPSPELEEKNFIFRIFPNENDKINKFQKNTTVPTKKSNKDYHFAARSEGIAVWLR